MASTESYCVFSSLSATAASWSAVSAAGESIASWTLSATSAAALGNDKARGRLGGDAVTGAVADDRRRLTVGDTKPASATFEDFSARSSCSLEPTNERAAAGNPPNSPLSAELSADRVRGAPIESAKVKCRSLLPSS